MIYTLTTNPAIDMNINTDGSIQPSAVNRTHGANYSANGKGLNVSYVLNHNNVDSKILGFFGGFSGKFIVDTFNNVHKIEVLPVWIDQTSRINVFLNDGTDEYKMVNEGPVVAEKYQEQLLQQINSLEDIDCLSISGSLPRGIDGSYYDKIFEICNKRNIKVVIDVSHKQLSKVLKFHPFLIKPNDEEIEDIFGWKINSEKDVIEVLKKLYELGAQNILLTLGDKGTYFYNGQTVYFAAVPPVKVLSSVCAGDSCLAGFVSTIFNTNKCSINEIDMKQISEESIESALKCACATGANVAQSNGIGDLAKVKEYIDKATFRIVE